MTPRRPPWPQSSTAGRVSTTSSTTTLRPVREWLPALASALDAKPPRRVPRWLARLAAGETAAVMMTDVRGASNAKAKRELRWQPRYPSWRLGFAQGLG
jgi:nucleoside-diphosphate-sugar epimerase